MLLPILAPHFMAVLVSRQTKRGKIKKDLNYIFMKKKKFLNNNQESQNLNLLHHTKAKIYQGVLDG